MFLKTKRLVSLTSYFSLCILSDDDIDTEIMIITCNTAVTDTARKERRKKPLAVIKRFSCSGQLSMEFFLLINMKMLANVGIFIVHKRRKVHIQLK